jgi:hypothetical protein
MQNTLTEMLKNIGTGLAVVGLVCVAVRVFVAWRNAVRP